MKRKVGWHAHRLKKLTPEGKPKAEQWIVYTKSERAKKRRIHNRSLDPKRSTDFKQGEE